MPRLLLPAFLALACLTGAAHAAPPSPDADLEPQLTRLGFGLRIDFGGFEQPRRSSLALTTTGAVYHSRFTLPLLALDFGKRRTDLGTLLGLRLGAKALQHEWWIRPRLTPLVPAR